MTVTREEQITSALYGIMEYESFEEFTMCENLDREEFAERMEEGRIQDITLATYNGATQTSTFYELTPENNYQAILTDLHETNSYNLLDGGEAGGDQEEMTQADYVREYTEFYNIFTLEGHIYINRD